jgi:RHS repeat-associated protein
VLANYEYGPFGEVIRLTGALAKNNPFRFSTKYQDDESDLLYYGYRYYKPSTGTWTSRDPIEEIGGENLYAFVADNPVNSIDVVGFSGCGEHIGKSGYPIYVFTDMNVGWRLAQLVSEGGGGGAFDQEFDNFTAKWEAHVSVLCNCPCGIRNGTRVSDSTINGPWIVFNASKLPLGIPLAKSILNGLGKILAYPVKQILGALTPGVLGDIEANILNKRIEQAQPDDDAYAGKWKDGKSPCDK